MTEDSPFDKAGLRDEEILSFNATFNQLKETLQAETDFNFNLDISQFDLFTGYKEAEMIFPIAIGKQNQKSHLTFTKIGYEYRSSKGGRYSGNEYQTWGVATLQNDFGHVIIRPETFLDKVMELFLPVELDFDEDPEFSKKFYVVTDNKEKTMLAMNAAFRNTVLAIEEKEFIIEVKGNVLLVGNRKLVEPQSAVSFAKFLNDVQRLM